MLHPPAWPAFQGRDVPGDVTFIGHWIGLIENRAGNPHIFLKPMTHDE